MGQNDQMRQDDRWRWSIEGEKSKREIAEKEALRKKKLRDVNLMLVPAFGFAVGTAIYIVGHQYIAAVGGVAMLASTLMYWRTMVNIERSRP